MRAMLDQFFKNRIGLAIAILFLLVLIFILVVPKIYFSLNIANKKSFWGMFLFSCGIALFIFFSSKTKQDTPPEKKAAKIPLSPKSYQNLLNEMTHCQKELKKNRIWIYGCLLMGWLALSLGTWIKQPPYNHPLFALPIFTIAMLCVTKSLEEESKLDVRVAECIVEGMEIEKTRPELKSSYFYNTGKHYQGNGMRLFVLTRLSPFMMIVFSLLNAGPIALFADYFSISRLIATCGFGVILGLAYAFLARMTCRPYFWMLGKMKNKSA